MKRGVFCGFFGCLDVGDWVIVFVKCEAENTGEEAFVFRPFVCMRKEERERETRALLCVALLLF